MQKNDKNVQTKRKQKYIGEQFPTSSGGLTLPLPKVSVRWTRTDEKCRSAWLIDSAVQEATNRGDWFNAIVFGGENPENLPRASIEAMQEYLFGTQPDVVKEFLKPL